MATNSIQKQHWESIQLQIEKLFWESRLRHMTVDTMAAVVTELAKCLNSRHLPVVCTALGGEWDFRPAEDGIERTRSRFIMRVQNPMAVFMRAAAKKILPSGVKWEIIDRNNDCFFVVTDVHSW